MISKERLQELIKQNKTVYAPICGDRNCVEIDLLPNYFIDLEDNETALKCRYNGYQKVFVEYIKDLFETREDAEWCGEFECVERTERLNLPAWEDVKCERDYFTYKFHIKGNYDGFGRLMVVKDYAICVQAVSLGVLHQEYFNEPATKENYMIACRKVKDLFLGGKCE